MKIRLTSSILILSLLLVIFITAALVIYDAKFNYNDYDILLRNRLTKLGFGIMYKEKFEIWHFAHTVHGGIAEKPLYPSISVDEILEEAEENPKIEKEVEEFARLHKDFEQFRSVMHELSLDPNNKNLTLQELYDKAKKQDIKNADFQGDWVYTDESEREIWFYLHLEQEGDSLKGWYSAVVNSDSDLRMKVDGVPEETENIISGIIEGDTAKVEFKSEWGGTGKVKIIYKDNRIEWTIIKVSENGYFWCPYSAVLKKYDETSRDG